MDNQPGGPDSRRKSWRRSDHSPEAHRGSVRKDRSWQPKTPGMVEVANGARRRRQWGRRLAASAVALGLVGCLVWIILWQTSRVPIVYAPPPEYQLIGPVTLHDVSPFAQGSRGDWLKRSTIDWHPIKLTGVDTASTLRDKYLDTLRQAPPGGPSQMRVLYLSAIGAVADGDGSPSPCLLPPQADRDLRAGNESTDPKGWLRVGDLLREIDDDSSIGDVLVVLDCCMPAHAEALGVLDGTFAAAVRVDLDKSPLKKVWVLLPAGPGEVSHAGLAEGGSIFARAFVEGLAGLADPGLLHRVSLGELENFVQKRVAIEARTQFAAAQHPFLVVPKDRSDRDIAYSSSGVGGRPRPTENGSDRVPGTDGLSILWKKAEEAGSQRLALHARPLFWSRLQQELLRAERLALIGADWGSNQETVNDTLLGKLKEPLLKAHAPLPSIRLENLSNGALSIADLSTRRESDPIDAPEDPPGLARRFADALSGKPPEEPVSPDAATPPDARAWRRRADIGWRALLERLRTPDATLDGAAWQRWLDLVGAPPEGAIPPVEIHLVRLLERWAPGQAAHPLLADLARLQDAAARAHAPPDTRADTVTRLLPELRLGDERRRTAFDRVLGGEEALAREDIRAAMDAYRIVEERGAKLSAAWQSIDVGRAEMPWLAVWEAREGDPDEGWKDYLEGLHDLEKALLHETIPDTDDIDGWIGSISKLATSGDSFVEKRRNRFRGECDRLSKEAENEATVAAIRRLLETPLVSARLRGELLQHLADWETRTGDDEGSSAPADPGSIPVAWLPWGDEKFVDPWVAFAVEDLGDADLFPRTDDSRDVAAAAAHWGTRIREQIRKLRDSLRKEDDSIDRDDERDDRAMLLRLRRLAVLAGSIIDNTDLTEDSSKRWKTVAEAIQERWAIRLRHAAGGFVADYFAAVEADQSAPWFQRAAEACLTLANDVSAQSGHPGDEGDDSLAQLLVEGAMAQPQIVIADTLTVNDQGIPRKPLPTVVVVDQRLVDRGLSQGGAAVWADKREAAREIVPVSASEAGAMPWPAHPDRRFDVGEVEQNALFRGHRMAKTLTIQKADAVPAMVWRKSTAAPSIKVRGPDRRMSVSLIFDFSGSMAETLGTNRYDKEGDKKKQRIQLAREATQGFIDALAGPGTVSMSLWLYGHRVRERGGETERTKPFEASVAADRRRGIESVVTPDTDVECLIPMAPIHAEAADVLKVQLKEEHHYPWGGTPLYYAVREAIEKDAPRVGVDDDHWVVLVTDGVNRARNGVTAADVRTELEKVNGQGARAKKTKLAVIAFDFQGASQTDRSALEELKQLAKDSGGEFIEASDGQKLKKALFDSLGLVEWEAEGNGTIHKGVVGGTIVLAKPQDGQRDRYRVRLAGPGAPESAVEVGGDEGLELFVDSEGRTLVHERYTGGSQQGTVAETSAELDGQTWYVAAHAPEPKNAGYRFPISIQNPDGTKFSLRPARLWAKVQPLAGEKPSGDPIHLLDLDYEPHMPVPVINLTVPSWPKDADAAEVSLWFAPSAEDPPLIGGKQSKLEEGRPLMVKEYGLSIELTTSADRRRIVVLEALGDEQGPTRMVQVEPQAEVIRRSVVSDSSGGKTEKTFRQEFDYVISGDAGRRDFGSGRVLQVDGETFRKRAAGASLRVKVSRN